jgi:threonyl-tRNA synthetase
MSNEILNSFGLKSFIVIRTTEEFWEKHKDWIIEIMASQGEPGLIELWPERYYYFILKYERPVLSAQGHTACLCTNQIDVESAQDFIEQYGERRQKYNITWHGKDGKKDHPIILHNSPSGAIERVIWALLETNARYEKEKVTGFKTWLSPVQVRVMAITDSEVPYAIEILDKINALNIRCDFDDRIEKIGKKIRSSEVEWIPYTIIVGKKEMENKTISVRKRLIGKELAEGKTNEQLNDISLEELITMVENDLAGYPKKQLPVPFRRFSSRIKFR